MLNLIIQSSTKKGRKKKQEQTYIKSAVNRHCSPSFSLLFFFVLIAIRSKLFPIWANYITYRSVCLLFAHIHSNTLRCTYSLACKRNKNEVMPLEKSYRFIEKKNGWMDNGWKREIQKRERDRQKSRRIVLKRAKWHIRSYRRGLIYIHSGRNFSWKLVKY